MSLSNRAVLGASAGLLLGLAACASEPPRPPPRTPGAAQGERQFRMAGLFISPCGKPFRAKPGEPYPVAAWFAEADKNRDGRLDLAEFQADADAFFKVLDQDGDGVVAGVEVAFYEQRIAPEILAGGARGALEARPQLLLAQYGGGGGGGGGGRGGHGGRGRGGGAGGGGARGGGGQSAQGASPYSLLGEPEPVTASDGDFNSLITLKEFEAAAARRFGLLDTDGDGYLTLATLPPTPVQTMGAGRGGHRRPA